MSHNLGNIPRARSQHRTLVQRRATTHFNDRLVQNTRNKSMRRMNTQKRMTYAPSSRSVTSLMPQGPTFEPIKLPDGTEVYIDDEELFEDVPSAPKKLALSKLRDQPDKAVDVQSNRVDPQLVKVMLSGAKFKHPPNGAQVERSVFRGVLPEEPEQKYQSIRSEIMAFTRDLERLKAESEAAEDKVFADKLKGALQFASDHLEQSHGNERYRPYFETILRGKHAWLDPPLLSCVDNIRSAAESAGSYQADDGDRLAYNLYRQQSRMAPGSFDKQYADCEKRIARLEKFIGFIHNMEYPYPDLMRAFTFLESRFNRIVTGQRFNVPSPQVRLVKEELRRIGHLMMQAEQRKPIKPEYQQRRSDWYKIDDLFSIMSEHDVLVFRFMNVISRLECLKRIHERSYDVIERTNTLYAQQAVLIEALQEDSVVLKTLLQTMEENSTQMRKNFNHLEHRQTVLEKTVQRM